MQQELSKLQAKSKELTSASERNTHVMTQIKSAHKKATLTCQQLRAALHEDVDKYCNNIEELIHKFCQHELQSETDRKLANDAKREEIAKISEETAKVFKQPASKALSRAAALRSNAQTLLKSLDSAGPGVTPPPPPPPPRPPRVALQRNHQWSLENALILDMQTGPRH